MTEARQDNLFDHKIGCIWEAEVEALPLRRTARKIEGGRVFGCRVSVARSQRETDRQGICNLRLRREEL